MKTLLCNCLSAALLCLAAGCVNVDYVGQTFPPTPEGSPVLCFGSREEIQPGKYRIIGRGIFTTTRRLDKYDVQEILTDEARKRGADAVVVVGIKKERRGIYEREPDVSAVDTAPASKSSMVKPGGEQLEVTLDRAPALEGEHHFRVETEIRVLFLKEREALEQELARRGRELDRLVKQPDPARSAPADKPKTDAATDKPKTDAATDKPKTDAATDKPKTDAVTDKPKAD